jgi:hypothetical protein
VLENLRTVSPVTVGIRDGVADGSEGRVSVRRYVTGQLTAESPLASPSPSGEEAQAGSMNTSWAPLTNYITHGVGGLAAVGRARSSSNHSAALDNVCEAEINVRVGVSQG